MDDLREVNRLRAKRYAEQRDASMMDIDSKSPRTRSRSPRRKEEEELRILSWNVDGLDSEGDDVTDMIGRTLWIVKTINECRPHIVFVQELIDFNLKIFREALGKAFHIYLQKDPKQPYFVGIFVHRSTVEVIGDSTHIHFPTSKMGRGGIGIKIKLKSSKDPKNIYECITCHLESLRESSGERSNQLSIIDSHIRQNLRNERNTRVIVGGDLNIRENEVPNEWKNNDCWKLAGRDPDNEYTWDLKLNDNARMPNGAKPRCRFDRVYIFSNDEAKAVKSFSLVGKERVDGLGRFPSDHFGILVSFDNNSISRNS
jgi:tyrosyl-DNA phosphodiesterase 2